MFTMVLFMLHVHIDTVRQSGCSDLCKHLHELSKDDLLPRSVSDMVDLYKFDYQYQPTHRISVVAELALVC